MKSGVLTTHLRPIRLAFLVEPRPAPLREAIALSSILWSGMLNPIIPVYRRLPASWMPSPFRAPTAMAAVNGYIRSFEPDFFVTVGEVGDLEELEFSGRRIRPRAVRAQFAVEGYPGVGVGLIETGLHLIEEEFKFQRRQPLELTFPQIEGGYDLFLAALFALPNAEDEGAIKQRLGREVDITEPVVKLEDYHRLLERQYMTPRRQGLWKLNYGPTRPMVFVLNPNSILDVIDYWNLRAAGYRVMPMPVALLERDWARQRIREFVESEYRPRNQHGHMMERPLLQVSRTLRGRLEEVAQYGRTLGIAEGQDEPKWMASPHYPRLWDRWAQEQTSESVQWFYSRSKRASFDGTTLELDPLKPDFRMGPTGLHGRFANVFEYQVNTAKEPIAEVFPDVAGLTEVLEPTVMAYQARVSRHGFVLLCDQRTLGERIEIPTAQDVFTRWLAAKGWTANLSPAGTIAAAMVRTLGDIDQIARLASVPLLNLLDRYSAEVGGIPHSEWQRVANPMFNPTPEALAEAEDDEARQRLRDHVERAKAELFQFLLDHRVIKLGADFQCPTCQRTVWRALNQLDYQLQCEHCLAPIPVEASHISRRNTWTYKPHGPFGIGGFGEGAYAVLLTLRFLQSLRLCRTTPLLSFRARNAAGQELEADLGLHVRESIFGDRWTSELAFAESKTFHEKSFKPEDIRRMNDLGLAFPGSLLVFSCLKPTLTDYETRLIRRLEMANRRRFLVGKPYCSVLVLTGTELISDKPVPQCWAGKGGLFDEWAKQGMLGLHELAAATQSLYLGLPSLMSWAQEQWSKRAKK